MKKTLHYQVDQKITSIVKKTAKVGAAVCVAAGAIALMTSGAALKALTEGGKYLKDTVKKIIDDVPEAETTVVEETPASEPAEEAAVKEEPSASE